VSHSIPPPEHPHSIAELLALVGAIRLLAFDRTLPGIEALGRIRDAFPRLRLRLTRTNHRLRPLVACLGQRQEGADWAGLKSYLKEPASAPPRGRSVDT
jgi:hypothetical protein